MLRPRRRAAFWWTFAVTLVVTLALGSPWAGDRFARHGNALTAQLISGLRYPGWMLKPVNSLPSTILVWASPALADIVLALLVGVVAMLVVTSRARIAALLAGWALLVIAAPVVGVARVFAVSPITHPGGTLPALLNDAVTDGLWFGAVAGWLIGVILASVVRKTPALQAASDDTDTTAEPVPARIWTPSQPDWQETSDMPALVAHPAPAQPGQAPWPTPAQPRQPGPAPQGPAPQGPLQGQPTRTRQAQPWGPAPEPESSTGPTRIVPGL